MNLEARLKRRYEKLVMAHCNSTASLSAGAKALADQASTFAHTQAMGRFLGNEKVTPLARSAPLIAACHDALYRGEGDYALCIHDWSRIHYGGHTSKSERGPIFWTGKLMLIYQFVRRVHETHTPPYFHGRI